MNIKKAVAILNNTKEFEDRIAYDSDESDAVEAVEKFSEQYISWGLKLKALIEHPACQKLRGERRCAFEIIKDTLDELHNTGSDGNKA